MPETIIVPLDSSKSAEDSIPFALDIARRTEAKITLLSVVEISAEFDVWVETAMISIDEEIEDWIAERRSYLEEVAARLEGVDVNVKVRAGNASNEILAQTEESSEPAIVMASHGRGGLSQIVIGSIALQVVHGARCPVFVVRIQPEDDPAPPPELDSVVIPLDGSNFSASVIDRGLQAIGEPKPNIHLLHVMDEGRWTNLTISPTIRQYEEAAQTDMEQHLNELAGGLRERGFTVTTQIERGRVANTILDIPGARNAGLIAMATHGRGGLGRALLGSVAQRVLSQAGQPLLLIRPEEQAGS